VDHIDFEVHQGEVFGFLGPNGAGKTTTQRMLAMLLEPAEGRIVINGLDLAVLLLSGVLCLIPSVWMHRRSLWLEY
jgi:ABC-type uncharacterized transport system ATPase subunit